MNVGAWMLRRITHNADGFAKKPNEKEIFNQQENNMKKFIQNIKGFFAKPNVSRRFLALQKFIGILYFILTFGILRYKYDPVYHTGFTKWEKDWIYKLFGSEIKKG